MKKSKLFWPLCIVLAVVALGAGIFVCVSKHQEKNKTGQCLLFIGDSITDGNWGVRSNSKQRNYKDLNHIYGHGYMNLCTSALMSRWPERGYVCYNRGISGNTTVDLQRRWEKDALALQPDVLTILVGVNDACHYQKAAGNDSLQFVLAPASYEARLRALLDTTLACRPNIRLILMTPFMAPVGKYSDNWEEWSALIQQYATAAKRVAYDYKTTLIDLQELFDEQAKKHPSVPMSYWIWDGIHPTAAGHAVIAERWLKEYRP